MRIINELNTIFLTSFFFFLVISSTKSEFSTEKSSDLIVDIIDSKWDQIQKGQWLIGFFDNETKDSLKLQEDWEVFALKCQEQGISVGQVFAPKNPGLYIRFLVTVFPKVFYIKNGVAHEVKHASRQTLITIIKDKTWSSIKPVNFLSNPFSVQISLLSHLFVHAVNLYNFEDAIVKQYLPFSSATDIAFGLTFIIVGTFLGLLLTCVVGFIQLCLESKNDKEDQTDVDQTVDEDSEEEIEEDSSQPKDENSSVRKRK